MLSTSIKFGGELIEELSQKIPSPLFALNELIKNAYDAFSPDVIIEVISSEMKIIITDKGNGMSLNEIDSLFHISKSTKKYGQKVTQNGITRITQGSKGLGFLSAFKFGDHVKWNTCNDGVCNVFSVKKSDLVAKDDISGVEIPIVKGNRSENGTEITIFTSEPEMEDLLSYLCQKKINEKLVSSIIDNSFNIVLKIESEKVVSTNKLKSFKRENEDSQLFYVKYDSNTRIVEFYHKGEQIKTVPFPIERSDYSVNLELVIFHFKQGKNSRTVSDLHRREHDGVLYPLVYINRNIFNNTIIFDPDLLRKKRSEDALAQMIGRVSILSESNGLEFNSDRTNFVDNVLTKSLREDLRSLNKLIQTTGARLKNELRNSENKKLIPTGKAIPIDKVAESKIRIASISIDRRKTTNFYIPSEQIALEEYIIQVKNSNGEDVAKSDVAITVEGGKFTERVLSSIEEPCELRVSYRYEDKVTGLVSTELFLNFEKQLSNISGKVKDKSLFTIQSGSGYNVKIETVSALISAIDKAYSTRHYEYLPLIACSLRAIFEISADNVLRKKKKLFKKLKSGKFNEKTKKEVKDSLLRDVVHIVALVNKNNRLKTEISDVIGMSYQMLTNSLNNSDFKVAIKNSHIGAHQSTRFLTKPNIEACAGVCSIFVVICDVIINLEQDKLASLGISAVDESDIEQYFS